MNELIVSNINKYAKMLKEKGYIQSGYIAMKDGDGIYITKSGADLSNVTEEDVVFVTDKTVETLEGNFRAAAVILFCAIRQDKNAGAAAIVDSECILKFSAKKKTLKPILDDMAQIDGISVKAASANTASEVVTALNGLRNSCFLPNAGAIVTGRTLDEVFTATLVLDKACNAEILAENKGGTKPLSFFEAFIEHMVFKLKYSKKNQNSQKAAESGEKEVKAVEEKPSAIVTDEQKKIAQEIKDAGIRLLDENLVQGTWGNIGVRLTADTMLATPSAIDYVMLEPSQMAIVNMTTMEWTGSNKPTSEKGIHAELMKADASSNATVHTHPFYGCILASMRAPLTVPAKYRDILGDVIPCAKYGSPGTGPLVKNTVEAIGNAPACFMANHGVIVKAKDLNEAFKICRALEDACRDYLTDVE
ncbi:MAG: class II aldolase/adducin family protein [Clostridia bacterium]